MSPGANIAAAVALVVCGALALGACGLGAGARPAGTTLTVTRDFGARTLAASTAPEVAGSETVMRLLARNTRVTTRFGGGFVESIDGLAGGTSAGRPVDWFFYVNGVEASKGAAATRLHDGDRIWWDRHDWGTTMRIPAVVGSFPEPFVHGRDGKRLPVRVECAQPRGAACRAVSDELAAGDVPAARGGLQTARVEATLRVLVGPWSVLRGDPALAALEEGPARSGVYARPTRDGRTIATLDAAGAVVARLGGGAGLVAALRDGDDAPVWTVTGTDDAGVGAAAAAFDERSLRNRFAVAVAGGRAQALPAR